MQDLKKIGISDYWSHNSPKIDSNGGTVGPQELKQLLKQE